MPRPRLHSRDDLLDVAEQLVTSGDPSGLTLRSLATAAGASNGSIYHAFGSKEDLLARLWLRAWSRLGELMTDALAGGAQGADAVVAVALAPAELVRRHPASARLFFAQRRDQLFAADADLPVDVAARLDATQARFVELLVSLARGVWGRGDREAVEAVAVCVVDLPSGILKRLLLEGRTVDTVTRRRIEVAVRAVLDVPLSADPTTRNPS